MSISQLTTYACLFTLVSTVFHVRAAEEGQSLLDAQKQKLQDINVDMNKTGKALYETFTSEPQKVVESGCLDNIRGVDFSVITVDPTNIWGALYSTLKDEITNQACSAATDFTNQIRDELNVKLEDPYGLVSLEISEGGSFTGDEGIFQPNVELDNEKVAQDITSGVLNDVRSGSYSARDAVTDTTQRDIIKSQKANNSSDTEKYLEDIIDIDKLFGGGEDDKKEEDDDQ